MNASGSGRRFIIHNSSVPIDNVIIERRGARTKCLELVHVILLKITNISLSSRPKPGLMFPSRLHMQYLKMPLRIVIAR